MNRSRHMSIGFLTMCSFLVYGQERNYNPPPMTVDVGNFHLSMNKLNGDQGLQSQYSWNLTGANPQSTEIFYWPWARWQTNMLYQIFNPVSLDDNGIIDRDGVWKAMTASGDVLTNPGITDWASETRRYRPPRITVDGIPLTPPYPWYVDRSIPSDIKLEWEDVCGQFGIRSHVEVFAYSNPDLGDFFIWKATQKLTGEVTRPRDLTGRPDSLPDQTIRFWWPISFSFGPSKVGERQVNGSFSYEGEDDLDSWFVRKSDLVTGVPRESLHVAYYWDADNPTAATYPTVGSSDDRGDPDRTTGFLHSTQVPGFALLHADVSASDKGDDPSQPYAMPHASIVLDLWGRRDLGLKLTYRGDDSRGRFPPDPITAGFSTVPQKGPMRFITVGPYSLTKDMNTARYDSVTFVVAVGVGSIGFDTADSIGRAWFNKEITDAQKNEFIDMGRDSLFKVMDRANWTWDRLSRGLSIPAAPPPPDIVVTSGPDRILVDWSYPEPAYFADASTGVDDWQAWRVYRKRGAYYVNDPLDQGSGEMWLLVHETTDRSATTFVDLTIQRGVDYYYAVTAVDDGSQYTVGPYPGLRLESSRNVTRSQLPAASFKPGLNESGRVRVVPNPATVASGGLGFSGTPDKILFVNLPVKCTLRVFTETGDHVTTIEHYGTSDEAWDQRTDGNQYVASGIYILTVTNSEDLDGNPLDNQFVKFVLVR